jgi:hypothetical protein
MKKCEKCGMTGSDDMTFCVNCGGNMVENVAEPAPAEAPSATITEDTVMAESTVVNDSMVNNPTAGMASAPVEPVVMADSIVEAKPRAKVNKNTALLIGIIAAVLVGIGGIVFGIVMANSKSSGNGGQTPSTPTTVTVTKTEVAVGKWLFEIPDGIEYEVDENGLWLSDGEEWESFTAYQDDVTYSNAKTNLSAYANAIAKNINGKVYKTGEDTFGDTDFLWMDFVSNGGDQYGTYAFSEASDMYTFLTSFMNVEATIDHDILDTISEVLSSAKKKTGSKGIDMDDAERAEFDIMTTIDFTKQEQE